jgi:hypothetical protein
MSQPLGLIQDQIGNVTAVAASAWALLGRAPVDLISAHFILGGDFESCPARYSSSEAGTVNWLQEHAYVH